jgi:histidinol-phosphate aminotransferase
MRENLFLELAAPGVRGLTPYQPGKPLAELEREYDITDAIKLASNENPLGPSPLAVAALREVLADLARYPDGGGFVLRHALSLRLGVGTDQITLGNGSNDVLELVARVFVTPEDEVIYSEHAFAVYPLVTQALGARAVVTKARDFGHDLVAMARAVTRHTRLVFIANPNNPTGTWLAADDLEGFVRGLPPHVIVVVDEAYFEYVTDPDYPNALHWLGRYPNLVITRTFSKAYGLAGLRVGYAVSHPAIADLLNWVRQPFNVNSLALAVAAAALDDEDHLARARAVNAAGMAQVTAGITALGLAYIPSVGNFVAVDVGRPAGPVYEALLRQGMIVRPVANYGLPHHLRVTIGLPAENARFLDALARALRS